MTSDAYKAFCGDLVKNFDKDWSKIGGKLDFGWKFLEHIPDAAWKPMIQIAISSWDGWPRNWVKAVKEIYEHWRRDAGHIGSAGYNRDDDPRFPVQLMQCAFDILERQGYPEYRAYCDQVAMPRTDRDRIEFKHKVCSGQVERPGRIPEGGHRVNERRPRPAVISYREPGEE